MRIAGLAKLISTMVLICAVIAKFRGTIRAFVPEGSLTAYDNALDAIMSACDVIRAIDYADDIAGTDPLWGAR